MWSYCTRTCCFHTIGQFIGSLGTLIPGIGPLLANVVSLPLNTWSRYSEISADRAGFLCCGGDLKVAQKALLRLSGGFLIQTKWM